MRVKAIILCVVFSLLTAGCARHRSEAGAASRDTEAKPPTAGVGRPVRVSPEGADAAEPAVAAGPDGTAYVAWVEHRPNREADVWLARVSGEGKAVGSRVRVNPVAGGAAAWHGDPPTVTAAPDGAVYVGWTARAAGAMHANTLHVSASRDGGHTFGPPATVNDDTKPGPHGMHSLAVGRDGLVHVAWLDERNLAPPATRPNTGHKHKESNREVFFATSSDGGRTFSANRRVATEVCPCCKTSLAAAPDGRVYVSWRQVLPGEFRHIAVASSSDGGNSFSEPVVVSDDRWMIAGCPVSGSALAVGSDGVLRVLWYTAGEAGSPGLYCSESRDGGKTFAARRPFARSSGRGTPVLLPGRDNQYAAVWEGGEPPQPVAARLTEEGQAGGSALSAAGELPAAASSPEQVFVSYILKQDGGSSVWLVRAKPPA